MAYLLPTNENGIEFALALRLATQLAIILVYLVPSIIAQRYQHPKQPTILLLNVALGWTIVGWIVALIWALDGTLATRTPARLLSHDNRPERSEFRENILRSKIDALKKSAITAQQGISNRQRVEKLKKLLAAAERELEELHTRSK
jgi:hypothetical protein